MQIIEKPWGQEEIIEINDRYMVKKATGKSASEHVLSLITSDVLKQSYFPSNTSNNSPSLIIAPK